MRVPPIFSSVWTVYGCVRLETAHIVDVEALTEKVLRDRPWRVEFAVNLFLIVAPSVETRFRI